jgi:hypothetical protein
LLGICVIASTEGFSFRKPHRLFIFDERANVKFSQDY